MGAVAVLLLFVLMMPETKLKTFYKDIVKYFPFGVSVNVIFFLVFSHFIANSFSSNSYINSSFTNNYLNWYSTLDSLADLELYGQLLYTQFVLQVLIVGLVLFLALVGVVFLVTNPVLGRVKNQTSFCQLSRNYFEQNSDQILL